MTSPSKILLALCFAIFTLAWAGEGANAATEDECSYNAVSRKAQLSEVDLPTMIRWASAVLFPGLAKNETSVLVYEKDVVLDKIDEGEDVLVLIIDNKSRAFFAHLMCLKNSKQPSEGFTGLDGIKGFSARGEDYNERESKLFKYDGDSESLLNALKPKSGGTSLLSAPSVPGS